MLTPTQRTIAQRMTESRTVIPEFTLEAEIDMEAAALLREELRELGRDPLPSFNDLVVKAVALALRRHPGLNASYGGDRVLRFDRINVGIAVATDDALYVPTIVDADRHSVFEIAEQARALVAKIGSGTIAPEALRDGTFTVSNLGMFGVRRFTAVINPPQAAILAVGEVARRPAVAEDGEIVARHQMDVVLSCDHRVVYGAEAARFLQTLKSLLERPVALVAG
jgi:pyruvate dehydrogenase E2 component (dihydrolipoamide acetyltransferase)